MPLPPYDRARRDPVTPDSRHFVVQGRLWCCSDPALPPTRREALVADLMTARRDVCAARRAADAPAEADARSRVDQVKRALGERGPVWWTDGAPDVNRHMAVNTPYRCWYETIEDKDND